MKETVRNSVHKGKERIADIKVKVSEIKADIRTKAISIVNDVKLKGMSALNRVAEMTGIKWKRGYSMCRNCVAQQATIFDDSYDILFLMNVRRS